MVQRGSKKNGVTGPSVAMWCAYIMLGFATLSDLSSMAADNNRSSKNSRIQLPMPKDFSTPVPVPNQKKEKRAISQPTQLKKKLACDALLKRASDSGLDGILFDAFKASLILDFKFNEAMNTVNAIVANRDTRHKSFINQILPATLTAVSLSDAATKELISNGDSKLLYAGNVAVVASSLLSEIMINDDFFTLNDAKEMLDDLVAKNYMTESSSNEIFSIISVLVLPNVYGHGGTSEERIQERWRKKYENISRATHLGFTPLFVDGAHQLIVLKLLMAQQNFDQAKILLSLIREHLLPALNSSTYSELKSRLIMQGDIIDKL